MSYQSDNITIEDIINRVHDLLNIKTKTSSNNIILSQDDQLSIKYFKHINNLKKISYVDNYSLIKHEYQPQQIEFYSFMYCIFDDLSSEFKKSDNKAHLINILLSDLILKIKRNAVVKETPTFILNKLITSNIQNNILTHGIIQFISIFFDINIFIIDNNKNYIIFYSLNQYYNKFKHNIILSKINYYDNVLRQNIVYYKNIYYENQTNYLVNELFESSPKMLVYSYSSQTKIDPSNDNSDYIIIKHMQDDDLKIIDVELQKNNIQSEIKHNNRLKKRNNKKIQTTTENMMDDIIITSEYTKEILESKSYKELRQIAKLNKIKLSVVDSNNKRKNKTNTELIEEILQHNH